MVMIFFAYEIGQLEKDRYGIMSEIILTKGFGRNYECIY